MKKQLEIMLQLQDQMNCKVNYAWRTAGYEWHRAIWLECGELMDHLGWKWWKKQEPNLEQAKLELVDIFHFMLSWSIDRWNCDDVAGVIESELQIGWQEPAQKMQVAVESLVKFALYERDIPYVQFARVMGSLGLTFDELFTQYVSKNVLNIFRQDNGYKEGTYLKHWYDGREDNEHLVEILDDIKAGTSADDFVPVLRQLLGERYAATVDQAGE
jgi:dimeric dUTPase (all-alpha-NTP-PPase superfamily)